MTKRTEADPGPEEEPITSNDHPANETAGPDDGKTKSHPDEPSETPDD